METITTGTHTIIISIAVIITIEIKLEKSFSCLSVEPYYTLCMIQQNITMSDKMHDLCVCVGEIKRKM